MTYTPDCTLPTELIDFLASDGFNALPELIRVLLNTAMQAERQRYLKANPYERSPERQPVYAIVKDR